MAIHDEPQRLDGLYSLLFDILRDRGYRPALHLVESGTGDPPRAWLSAAGFGALGHTIDHAARLYVQAGGSLAADPALRDQLRRLGETLAV